MTIGPETLDSYERGGELTRLREGVGRLEFWRTQDVLRRVLPPAPARVLDVGGGTGAHAEWLAADGYEVELIDPVPLHVARAERLPGVTARLGDARQLPAPDGSADAAGTGLMVSPREGGFRGCFHDPDEIPGEFADAGLPEPARYGLEGAFWLYGDIDVWLDDEGRRELLLDAARRLESVPSLLGVSGHLPAASTVGTG
ncbi:class I SAM-dependent methyltransferase [Nonomuraea sp. NPDC048826]|uniref:class I SAM-dependent methyltransferase n=1 Tax=Nonomuraea sp. NPDC048826 TaxID=3364347 RepID=UPI00371638A2